MQKEKIDVLSFSAYTALVVSVVALFISWAAYNRAGENLSDVIQDETNQVVNQTERVAQDTIEEVTTTAMLIKNRAELSARLVGVRAQIAADTVTEETIQEVEDIRMSYKELYQDASEEAQEQAQQVDQELERLETSLRDNTSDALLVVEGLIELMRQDIQDDEEGNPLN
jgi:gas vesicle protein